jgi:predicted nucleotidyltransferase
MFSKRQMQILAILISQPGKEYHFREIARCLHVQPGLLQHGINSLENQGLLISHYIGRQRFFRINTTHALYKEVKGFVQKTVGVEKLLRGVVMNIPGITAALIYGSYVQDTMRSDSDIDLIAVGNLNADDLLMAKLREIERKIQREVNYKFYSMREFCVKRKMKDPFLEEVLSDKHIMLKGKI